MRRQWVSKWSPAKYVFLTKGKRLSWRWGIHRHHFDPTMGRAPFVTGKPSGHPQQEAGEEPSLTSAQCLPKMQNPNVTVSKLHTTQANPEDISQENFPIINKPSRSWKLKKDWEAIPEPRRWKEHNHWNPCQVWTTPLNGTHVVGSSA